MHHHFLDHYCTIESPVHAIDPRMKIISAVFALIAIVTVPNGRFASHVLIIPLLITVLYLSKIPAMAVIKRMTVIIVPTAIIAIPLLYAKSGLPLSVTGEGVKLFGSVVLKAVSAVVIMTTLTATTSFRDLTAAMQWLKVPVIFTSLLAFIYRYVFVFVDEAERMNIGRRSRSFGSRPVLAMKGLGWLVSSLFLRSFERGERVYAAMCARGYNATTGGMPVFDRRDACPTYTSDLIYCGGFVLIVLAIRIVTL